MLNRPEPLTTEELDTLLAKLTFGGDIGEAAAPLAIAGWAERLVAQARRALVLETLASKLLKNHVRSTHLFLTPDEANEHDTIFEALHLVGYAHTTTVVSAPAGEKLEQLAEDLAEHHSADLPAGEPVR